MKGRGVKSAHEKCFSEERPVRWGRRGYPQLAVPSGKTGLTFGSLRLRPHGVISGPHRAAEGSHETEKKGGQICTGKGFSEERPVLAGCDGYQNMAVEWGQTGLRF